MTSKKKSEEGTRRNNLGNDAEDWAYIKKKINPLNKVERSPKNNSPYDFSVEKRDLIKKVKKSLE